MRIIFIRHGDRIGNDDEITSKGYREAILLSERVGKWKNVKAIYCSPFKRVKQTMEPSVAMLGLAPEPKEWLKEFEYRIPNPTTGVVDIPWDLYPDYYNDIPEFFDKDNWLDTDFYKTDPIIAEKYAEAIAGLEEILSKQGFIRDNNIYRYDPDADDAAKEDDILIFFSHFGISSFLISYLLNIPAPVFLTHFICPPTGVTILNSEMRLPGSNAAHFRLQCFGDTSHLKNAHEPLSTHGAFSSLFDL